MKLRLASRSPRRQQLLAQLGVAFEVLDVEVDERWDGEEPARLHVPRLALEKARAGVACLPGSPRPPVLAADTAVVLDDEVLGKAEDAQGARRMLERLSSRAHQVYTAVALDPGDGRPARVALSVSTVCMAPLSPAELGHYLASGEPLGKAGGYAIQGLAAAFIARLEGSYSGVMGLPLYETAALLREAGLGGER